MRHKEFAKILLIAFMLVMARIRSRSVLENILLSCD
jgi:hypothetical protein